MAAVTAAHTPPSPARLLPVAVLLWLAGLYLRIPILVAPPLAPFISDDLALSQALTGALTTLPILMLAVGAMPGSLAITRIGPRTTLALAITVMALGSSARALAPESTSLMLASAVMGLGVAMMQPALPALLPRWLQAHHLALGTAIYMNGMLMGEFIGAGLTLPVLMPLFDQNWRWTLLAWSLPALLVAAALYLPRRDNTGPVARGNWLPDWRNPLTVQIGLVLGMSGSVFFGLNAYMSNLMAQQGRLDLLSEALFWYNAAQVAASLVMLKMARLWVGRKGIVIACALLCILGTAGSLLLQGWAFIVCATLASFIAGILLILLVALPPLVVSAGETGRLSAGTFLVGYTVAFAVPMAGGLVADATGDARHAVMVILGYGLLILPLTLVLNLQTRR
ncbi:MFS transporter [Marinobacter salinisoli]|uniref:MFS transporter n=1 Tax=Marinobacter salinisoli TaxID=2769486 RepID=A0ABX7MTY6_9GAMM|nr:MFS transporter [Marinobacter salinisoli]QSP95629.1 MFS transporter [Marinobacter salinisoli]